MSKHDKISLFDLSYNQKAIISEINLPETSKNMLMELGLFNNVELIAKNKSPLNGSCIYQLGVMQIAMGREIAENIYVDILVS